MNEPAYAKRVRKPLWTIFQAACLIGRVEPPTEPKLRLIPDETARQSVSEILEHLKDLTDSGQIRKVGAIRWRVSGDYAIRPIVNRLVAPADCIEVIHSRGDFQIPAELASMTKCDEKPGEKAIRAHREREAEKAKGIKNFNKVCAARWGISVSRFKQLAAKGGKLPSKEQAQSISKTPPRKGQSATPWDAVRDRVHRKPTG